MSPIVAPAARSYRARTLASGWLMPKGTFGDFTMWDTENSPDLPL
jgi:hypothetical protein